MEHSPRSGLPAAGRLQQRCQGERGQLSAVSRDLVAGLTVFIEVYLQRVTSNPAPRPAPPTNPPMTASWTDIPACSSCSALPSTPHRHLSSIAAAMDTAGLQLLGRVTTSRTCRYRYQSCTTSCSQLFQSFLHWQVSSVLQCYFRFSAVFFALPCTCSVLRAVLQCSGPYSAVFCAGCVRECAALQRRSGRGFPVRRAGGDRCCTVRVTSRARQSDRSKHNSRLCPGKSTHAS